MKAVADQSTCLERRTSRPKDELKNTEGRQVLSQPLPGPRCSEGRGSFAFVGTTSSAAFLSKPCSAFRRDRLLTSGPLIEVALAAHCAIARDADEPVMIFDDATGVAVDLNLGASKARIIAQLYEQSTTATTSFARKSPLQERRLDEVQPISRRRGRPKLGVVAREVTLLPRHWEWLAAQPGGTSVTLRRLVENACQASCDAYPDAMLRERAYLFINAVGKSLPNFNETVSALLAGNRERFTHELSFWPVDIAAYAFRLAFDSDASTTSNAHS